MFTLKKTKALKRLSKCVKSKRGATLIELVATIAILSIVASLSLQAIFIAGEQSRRVNDISECQRVVSLMEKQISMYARNATKIDFVTENVTEFEDLNTAISNYVDRRNSPPAGVDPDPFHDDDVTTSGKTADKDADYILYWAGNGATNNSTGFHITLAKYNKDATGSNKFETITTVDNIKEINFMIRELSSKKLTATDSSYLLDYTLISPTGFEILDQTLDSGAAKKGAYSVFSGVVLNNVKNFSGPHLGNSFRISEPIVRSNGSKDYNFVIFRTVRVAK